MKIVCNRLSYFESIYLPYKEKVESDLKKRIPITKTNQTEHIQSEVRNLITSAFELVDQWSSNPIRGYFCETAVIYPPKPGQQRTTSPKLEVTDKLYEQLLSSVVANDIICLDKIYNFETTILDNETFDQETLRIVKAFRMKSRRLKDVSLVKYIPQCQYPVPVAAKNNTNVETYPRFFDELRFINADTFTSSTMVSTGKLRYEEFLSSPEKPSTLQIEGLQSAMGAKHLMSIFPTRFYIPRHDDVVGTNPRPNNLEIKPFEIPWVNLLDEMFDEDCKDSSNERLQNSEFLQSETLSSKNADDTFSSNMNLIDAKSDMKIVSNVRSRCAVISKRLEVVNKLLYDRPNLSFMSVRTKRPIDEISNIDSVGAMIPFENILKRIILPRGRKDRRGGDLEAELSLKAFKPAEETFGSFIGRFNIDLHPWLVFETKVQNITQVSTQDPEVVSSYSKNLSPLRASLTLTTVVASAAIFQNQKSVTLSSPSFVPVPLSYLQPVTATHTITENTFPISSPSLLQPFGPPSRPVIPSTPALNVLMSENLISRQSSLILTLKEMCGIVCIDCALDTGIDFVIDEITAISIIPYCLLRERLKLKEMIRKLTKSSFKYSKIWLIVIEDDIPQETDVLVSFLNSISNFPCNIWVRYTLFSNFHDIFKAITCDAATHAATKGVNSGLYCDREFLKSVSDCSFARQCGFLSLFPVRLRTPLLLWGQVSTA